MTKQNTRQEHPRESPQGGNEAVLRVRDLQKTFPAKPEPIRAIRDISLDVWPGQIVGLVGPDGAGKTTLLRLIAGLLSPDRGELSVTGLDIRRDPRSAQLELGYMPQQFGLYTDLTVQENLDLYADLRGQPAEQRRERYAELMNMTGLQAFTHRLAGRLSGGMQQKLGLACVLARSARLVILDEPTAGVDPVSRRELWAIIRQLVDDERAGVLLSTGYLDEAEHCDEVVVLTGGKVLGRGAPTKLTRAVRDRVFVASVPNQPPRDIQTRLAASVDVLDASVERGRIRVVLKPDTSGELPDVIAGMPDARYEQVSAHVGDGIVAMLLESRHSPSGTRRHSQDLSNDRRRFRNPSTDSEKVRRRCAPQEAGAAVIEVRDLRRRFGDFYAVKGLDFDVAAGEVFGLLGANGAGKSTTFRMLCGLLPPSFGSLRVAGVDMRRAPSRARARIGYMSQTFSLYRNLTVMENLRFFSSAYGLFGRRRRERLAWALHEFQLEPWKHRPSEMLPLGYRQRLALAAALIHQPRILFLDEPTSGVDPLARHEFWHRISGQAAAGVTVMVTTHFMEEAEYCDRLAIMMAGELLTLGAPAEIRENAETLDNPEPTIEDAFIHLIESRAPQEVEEE